MVDEPAARVPCVGAIVHDRDGRLLLVRRGQPPGLGQWSVPGGRVEPGESDAQAVAREVREETQCAVEVGGLVGSVERAGPGGVVYDIRDYLCTHLGGEPVAGTDAAEAAWVTSAELARLDCVDGLVESLRRWRVLPRA